MFCDIGFRTVHTDRKPLAMSNSGITGHPQMPPRGGELPTQVPVAKNPQPQFSPTPPKPVTPDNWDTIVAAIHSISSMGQPVLLTLTAKNMKPIWIDFNTRRFYMEAVMSEIPAIPIGVKVFSHPIDPESPPYPWVAWKSLDALLWNIGERAFATGQALWLIYGERYTLSRWPNLTEISYGVDDLRSISMLANGMITIDELALVARTSVEHSQKIISILSLLGVLRGSGAPQIVAQPVEQFQEPVRVEEREPVAFEQPVQAERTPEIPSFFGTEPIVDAVPVEELHEAPYEDTSFYEVQEAAPEQSFDELLYDESPATQVEDELLDVEEPVLEIPEEYLAPAGPNRGNQAMVSGPSFFEEDEREQAQKAAPLKVPGFEPAAPAVALQEFPSFSEIMKAAPAVEEEKAEEQPTGLFGLLRKKLGKK